MFFNEYASKDHVFDENVDPKHYLFDFEDGLNHIFPILICLPLLLVNNYSIKYLSNLLYKINCLNKKNTLDEYNKKEISINENQG
jgi:hypothetical protein